MKLFDPQCVAFNMMGPLFRCEMRAVRSQPLGKLENLQRRQKEGESPGLVAIESKVKI